MTPDEAQAIHGRLDKQDEKLDRIVEAVTTQVAICAPTRAKLSAVCETVHGNGREGHEGRLARLETVREIGGKGFWAMVALMSAIISGVVLAGGGVVFAWWRGQL